MYQPVDSMTMHPDNLHFEILHMCMSFTASGGSEWVLFSS